MGEAWALAARRTNARGPLRLRLSFRTAHTAHACRVVAQATLTGRSGAHMLTPVWALVAKAMENHDQLMQSPRGRGRCGNGGPEGMPICFASASQGACGEALVVLALGWRGLP